MNKLKYFFYGFLLLFHFKSIAQQGPKPALEEHYSIEARSKSGIALGGLGTGSVELRKDGKFYNWTIFNNYPMGAGPLLDLPTKPNDGDENAHLFFVVKYQLKGKQPVIKLLQINNDNSYGGLLNEAPEYYFPWLSSVEQISYSGRFPFVNMKFSDKNMPFDVFLEAYSPFVPHDPDASAIPGAYFDFKIVSKVAEPVEVCIIGTLRNLVGYDIPNKTLNSTIKTTDNYKYFVHSAGNLPENHDTQGNMALGAIGGDEVSYYLGWAHRHPYYERLLENNQLGNIDDSKNRLFTNKKGQQIAWANQYDNNQLFKSAIGITKTIKSDAPANASFFLNWYFPNAYGWVHEKKPKDDNGLLNAPKGYVLPVKKTKIVGNYYANNFSRIDELAAYMVKEKAILHKKSDDFIAHLYSSSMEQYMLDQVNAQLNTFVTSSIFDQKGRFAIREGLTNNQSWGPFATSDVSLYGAVPILNLFPDLHHNMVKAHRDNQTPEGEINHGLGADLDFNQNGTFGVFERVDLAPNFIQLTMRDYLFTKDEAFLKEMWPALVKAAEYVLREKDLTGDQVPDMHGIMCSYDNFPMHGLSAYIATQWVTAMEMMAIGAKDMGDKKRQRKYGRIAENTIELIEEHLWNGSYYRLSNDYLGKKGKDEGCLTDQLFGQWVALEAGLERQYPKAHVASALKTILDYSYIENNYLRNCTWPEHLDFFPMANTNLWVDQANTPWTGVELAFASFLIREGMVEEGKAVVKSVDDRYRTSGLYWDHQEFGGHYYRPMSAWAIINAMSGYQLVKNQYTFRPVLEEENFCYFFSANSGTGHFLKQGTAIKLSCLTRQLDLEQLKFPVSLTQGEGLLNISLDGLPVDGYKVRSKNDMWQITFTAPLNLKEGQELQINYGTFSANQ